MVPPIERPIPSTRPARTESKNLRRGLEGQEKGANSADKAVFREILMV